MTNEQARKLLGGYATNSLTEAERKALFEAALDDQELFDALQQEQALKELLADPVSRRQVQGALAQKRERAAWWSRGWAWGGLAGAVTAAVLIVAVVRMNPPKVQVARVQPTPAGMSVPASPPRQAASREPTPQPRKSSAHRFAIAPDTKKDELKPLAAPPPPPPAVPVPSEPAPQPPADTVEVRAGAAPAGAAQVQAPQPGFRAATALRDAEPRAGLAGGLPANYQAPLLGYSLVRRDPSGAYSPLAAGATLNPGDSVRIVVHPGVAGYLSLYEFQGGQWKKLLPETEQGIMVAANASQTIPDAPIVVNEGEQRFRLMLVPVSEAKEAGKGSPVVDIAIGAGRNR